MVNKKKISVNEEIQNKIHEQVEEMRQEVIQSVSKKDSKSKKNALREEFELFWTKHKHKYKQFGDITDVVFAHFVTYGFTTPDKFEEGLKHFGFE